MGRDPRDGTSLDVPAGGLLASLTGDVRGLRIGLPRECFGEGLDSAVRACVLAAADVLREPGGRAGAPVLPHDGVCRPDLLYHCLRGGVLQPVTVRRGEVWLAGGGVRGPAGAVSAEPAPRASAPRSRRRILLGTFVLSSGYYDAYYLKALRAKGMIKRAFDEAFCQCDVMLTPTGACRGPPAGGEPVRPLADVPERHRHRAGEPGGAAGAVYALRL